MKTISLKCPACGAPLSSEENRRWIYCSYCGTKIMLDDIEYAKEAAKTDRIQQITGMVERIIGTKAEREAALEKSREDSHKSFPEIVVLLIFMVVLIAIYIAAMVVVAKFA